MQTQSLAATQALCERLTIETEDVGIGNGHALRVAMCGDTPPVRYIKIRKERIT